MVMKIPPSGVDQGRFNVRFYMTLNLSRRLGKFLFPHLPRDQRQNHLSTIVLVMIFSLTVAGTLALLMLRTGGK